MSNPLAMANLAFALSDDSNKKQYIKNCMLAKGYSLADKNSIPARGVSESIAPPQVKPVPQINPFTEDDEAPPSFDGELAKAQTGDPKAQYWIGVMYAYGVGVEKDSNLALQWYQKAAVQAEQEAQQGKAEAQYILGLIYDNGRGLPKDSAKAMYWYRIAAEHGEVNAQYDLMVSFDKSDPAESLKWARNAANQGNVGAQYHLGFLYEQGISVPKDYVESYKWFNLAGAGKGGRQAKQSLERLEVKMTPEQIAEAQRLSREFKTSK